MEKTFYTVGDHVTLKEDWTPGQKTDSKIIAIRPDPLAKVPTHSWLYTVKKYNDKTVDNVTEDMIHPDNMPVAYLRLGQETFIALDGSDLWQGKRNGMYPTVIAKMIGHTLNCLRHITHTAFANFNYRHMYPNSCPHCYGKGGFDFPGTWNDPPDFEFCPICSEWGYCPRCGAGDMPSNFGTIACPHCGYDWGNNPDDYAPGEYSCDCWSERNVSVTILTDDDYQAAMRKLGFWYG